MRRIILVIVSAIALSWSHVVASADYDYGDKMLRWVREDAARQSVELAKKDLAVRDLNAIMMTIQVGTAAVSKINNALTTVTQSTEITETTATGLSSSAAAFLRRADSAANIDRLLTAAAGLQMSNANFTLVESPLGKTEFAALGLPSVGRQTLMESFFTVSTTLKPTLPEAYFEVSYSYDQGKESVSAKAGKNTPATYTVGVALVNTGNPYAVAAGVTLIFGSMMYSSIEDEATRRKIDEQNRLLSQAIKELESVLPNDEAVYNIYIDVIKGHRKNVAPQLKAFRDMLDQADQAWRQAMALQMARAGQAGALLTEERLKRIVQDANDPASRFMDAALAIRLTDEAADFSSKTAQALQFALSGCSDAISARALDDASDSLYEGQYVFRAILQEPKLAEIHDSIGAVFGHFNEAAAQLKSQIHVVLKRPCAALGIAKSAQLDAKIVRNLSSLRAIPKSRLTAREPTLLRSAFQSLQRLTLEDFDEGSLSCTIYRTASGLRCGAGSPSDQPYGQSFNDGARNPGSDILTGRRDGGFVSDEHVLSNRADAGKQNVERRVSDLQQKYSALTQLLPSWSTSTGVDLAHLTSTFTETRSQHEDALAKFSRVHASELGEFARKMAQFASSPLDLNAASATAASVTGITANFPSIDLAHVRAEGPHMPSLNPRQGTADLRGDVSREFILQARSEQAVRSRVEENLHAGRQDSVFRSVREAEENARLAHQYLAYADALSARSGDAYLRFGSAAERAARFYLAEAALLRRYGEALVTRPSDARRYVGDWPFSLGNARDALARFISCTSAHGDNPDLAGTPCNVFTYHVLGVFYGLNEAEFKVGGQPMLANQMADYVASSDNWRQIGTIRNQNNIDDAARLAIEGHAVIGVYKNNNGHGHVFTVLPGVPTYVETRPDYAAAWGGLRQPQIANFALDGCSSTPSRCYVDGPVSQGVRFKSEQLVSSIILWVRKYP